jgi:hypothetical protein
MPEPQTPQGVIHPRSLFAIDTRRIVPQRPNRPTPHRRGSPSLGPREKGMRDGGRTRLCVQGSSPRSAAPTASNHRLFGLPSARSVRARRPSDPPPQCRCAQSGAALTHRAKPAARSKHTAPKLTRRVRAPLSHSSTRVHPRRVCPSGFVMAQKGSWGGFKPDTIM